LNGTVEDMTALKPPFVQARVGIVKSKLPRAIEVHPGTAFKLWARIFWSNGCHNPANLSYAKFVFAYENRL
jgi:hypothetical protein